MRKEEVNKEKTSGTEATIVKNWAGVAQLGIREIKNPIMGEGTNRINLNDECQLLELLRDG